jgi:hypothetical protein
MDVDKKAPIYNVIQLFDISFTPNYNSFDLFDFFMTLLMGSS